MKVSILHHHLNPGGVTRIIYSQVSALRKVYPDMQLQLLLGHADQTDTFKEQGVKVSIQPLLNYLYDSPTLTGNDIRQQADIIYQWIKKQISADEVLHVHNMNLGKNPAYTYALYRLASERQPIINHAHDFAEDRPDNWAYLKKTMEGFLNEPLQDVLYPAFKHYLYGVLNSFDYKRLIDYGVPGHRVYLFPNPVHLPAESELPDPATSRKKLAEKLSLNPEKPWFTYPVRVIRRKNIGELVLLAWLFRQQAEWMVTQPPKNPVEVKFYMQWREFCQQYVIPLRFDVGEQADFFELLRATDSCISTSRQEGFGMSFLEPWLAGTPIIGRKLKMVMDDMTNQGIEFPLLYDQLMVPFDEQLVDFKDLNDHQQRQVILQVIENKISRQTIFNHNPFLEKLLNPVSLPLIEQNKDIIQREYSSQSYAKRLYESYQKAFG